MSSPFVQRVLESRSHPIESKVIFEYKFLVRAAPTVTWVRDFKEIQGMEAFKQLKADVTKGGGKLSKKSGFNGRVELIMKSPYVSPNPLERSGWKPSSFTPGDHSNSSTYSKGGFQVQLDFPGGFWYVAIAK